MASRMDTFLLTAVLYGGPSKLREFGIISAFYQLFIRQEKETMSGCSFLTLFSCTEYIAICSTTSQTSAWLQGSPSSLVVILGDGVVRVISSSNTYGGSTAN